MPKKRNYKHKTKNKNLFKKILRVVFLFFIVFFISFSIYIYNIYQNLPDPSTISSQDKIESTKIYDRTGKILLYDIHGEEKRTIIPSEKISQYVKDATLAAEDDEFYLHKGIDFKSILSALFDGIVNPKKMRGGSTITQQLIKNSLLTPERSIKRKIKEAILAIKLEKTYRKDEILTFYLNQIPYGSNAYGIEAAAQTFFNKEASKLTLAESALLAGLPKAPSKYSPYKKDKQALLNRQKYILNRMYKIGYINKEELNTALNETLVFSEEFKGIKAPHFVLYVKDYLDKKYKNKNTKTAGLKVYTTLDYDIQKLAEKTIKDSKDHLKKYGASNAAMVVLDSKTGQILAMVGSYDYFDKENNGNYNVITSLPGRQPGSSFKPLVYANLLERGFTPETVFFDVETEFSTSKNPNDSYKPKNYNGKFQGPVALKYALAQSLNIPAVKALYIAGIDNVLPMIQDMGISTIKDKSRVGLSLVLGSAEVKPIEMAEAFSVFSNQGIKNKSSPILKIENPDGSILEKIQYQNKRVLSKNTANTISKILSDNSLRAPVFGINNSLNFKDIDVAAKTGTTQEFRDAWVVGYTTNTTIAVWVGNNDNTSMKNNAAGSIVAGPIFNKFVNDLSKIRVFGNFEEPVKIVRDKKILNGGYTGTIKLNIDKISKKLATKLTPKNLIEEKEFNTTHNLLYYIDKNDILGPRPKNPENDPQYNNWEKGLWDWVKSNPNFNFKNDKIPTEYDDIHTIENKPIIKIIEPSNNLIKSNKLKLNLNIKSNFEIKEVNFYIDNKLITSKFTKPYEVIINLPKKETKSYNLKIIAYDKYQNKNEINYNLLKIN